MTETPKRLNLGCGDDYREGWLNVDISSHESVNADLIADALDLPFVAGSFSMVLCSHMLEHVSWDDAAGVLQEIRRVLEPGGTALLVVPDTSKVYELGFVEDQQRVVWGTQRHSHDRHLWPPNGPVVDFMACAAGFVMVRQVNPFDHHLSEWKIRDRATPAQACVMAVKGAG